MNFLPRALTVDVLSSRRNPLFAAGIVLTLALGIAPNCVIFAVMDSIYFRPLPYPAQHRLALLNLAQATNPAPGPVDAFTFVEVQRRIAAAETVALYRNAPFDLNADERPERVPGQMVTPGFFQALGMLPSKGRAFRTEDCRAGGADRLIVSDATWKDYFSGRADIVGLNVRVNGGAATVVGVMPPAFTSFMEGRGARVWAPLCVQPALAPSDAPAGNAIVRFGAQASLEQARLELASAHAALARQFPDFYRGRRPVLRDFRSSLFGGLGPGIRMLSVIVGLLLLIACGNAANLLLGRAIRRSRETAIRAALGASRAQLVGAMLVESLVLALAATVVGLGLAYWGTWLLWAGSARMFRVIGVDAIAFDGRVVGFSLVLALMATVLFGALPALRGTKTDIVAGLKRDDSAGRTVWRKGRMRRALVVSQVVLCVVTMIVTTLVFRSFLQVARSAADPGFNPRGLLIASLAPPATAIDPMAVASRTEEAKRRIAGIAGVEKVALVSQVPFLQGGSPKDLFRRAAGTEDRQGDKVAADVRLVDADFFALVSMPLLRGRTFTGHDDRTSLPVIIVSDRLASAVWRDAEAVGDRLLVDGVWRTVVGIVRSTIAPSPFRPASREAFIPYAQAAPAHLEMLIRSSLPAASLTSEVRGQVQAIDPDQPVAVRTLEDALDEMMTPFRLILVLMAVFATIALALPAIGLYGVITHDVSRRKHEIGIRIAIGARRSEIVGMVIRQGLRLAGWGVAFGLLLGLAAAKIVPAALFGTGGLSLYHYVAIALTWLAIAVAACLVPARRAAALEATSALRYE